MTDVNAHLITHGHVGAVLIDLGKAFDSIWINGLIFVLIKKKIPEQHDQKNHLI